MWVVRSDQIVASDPFEKDMNFDPMEDKVYRHPSFYKLPAAVDATCERASTMTAAALVTDRAADVA